MSSITYNKLWQEAQMQLNDLLQIEQPKTEPKPENVNKTHNILKISLSN